MSKVNTPPTAESVSQTLKEWSISAGYLAAQGPHGRFAQRMMKDGVYSYLQTTVSALGLEPVQALIRDIVRHPSGEKMAARLGRWHWWREHQDVEP